MDDRYADLNTVVPLSGLLGYLNFSQGKADPRFQKQLNDAYQFLAEHGAEAPWQALAEILPAQLTVLREGGSAAFKDTQQAEAVIALVFDQVLPAYRRHHGDLLFHLSDAELYQPFFLARVFEAVLAQGSPWDEDARIVKRALQQLNDYVGHRPVAILETRPKGEPYEHERVRPIPIYLRGIGVAHGRYHDLLSKALEILRDTDPGLLDDASFDLELMDELAVDPRAYDHNHPVNRRPNYVFGEWDPHHLDNQGRYRRYVARAITLDAALDRMAHPGEATPEEALFEAAAVLAGTILMSSGVSGSSPTAHDSTVTIGTLIPRIARVRDAFYTKLMERVPGAHGQRLRAEAERTKQPFGGSRQYLNHFLARHRAAQLQQRHLAIVFATMGYPEASREQVALIPAPSVRILTEILIRLTTGQRLIDRGELDPAAPLIAETEDLLQRGIQTGAMADPWNILGFQGQYPLFQSSEDSVHDTRIDELVRVVELLFNFYARLLSEAAAAGNQELRARLAPNLRKLATWWDRFASVEVSGVTRIHGGEAAEAAEHVAAALARWHERGAATADLGFWRQHLKAFNTPKAFAIVVDALLQKQDYRASMALLMNWVNQSELVPLEEGEFSFHALALRWMLSVIQASGSPEVPNSWPLVRKFYDHLEANAEDLWHVPGLDLANTAVNGDEADEEEEENPYAAAYDDMTYEDTTDDGEEGSVADGSGPIQTEFSLEEESQRLLLRLRFLSTSAQLWLITARQGSRFQEYPDGAEAFTSWLNSARARQPKLLELLDAVHAIAIPEPIGAIDALVEYDRRRGIKEQLLDSAIDTCLHNGLASRALWGALGESQPRRPRARSGASRKEGWEPLAIQLEHALVQGSSELARQVLPSFVQLFQKEPLLHVPLDAGGNPRHILRTRLAQATLRTLLEGLPRLGLVRETYHLLQTARSMEQNMPTEGRKITDLDRLFQVAFQAVVEAVVEGSASWPEPTGDDQPLVKILEMLTRPFLSVWIEHSRTLRLSSLEGVSTDNDWKSLQAFIQRYGTDLFHARFLNLANLRGILHRGVGPYLDYLAENPDPLHPIRLVEELDNAIAKPKAVQQLQLILQTLVENQEEYKDYNTTTPHSDYGDRLYILLDFLRIKASYERYNWHFRPLVMAHEVLARRKRSVAAVYWQEACTRLSHDLAEQHLEQLQRLEQTHGMKLRTITDRLEERFVKPLAVDRLAALIAPAMEEARAGGETPSFTQLQKEAEPFLANPSGVGLDVPYWLRRLEMEIQRVRASRTAIAGLAEEYFRMPRLPLSLEDLQRQMRDWEKPLLGK